MVLDDQTRRRFKELYGFSEEDFDNLSPGMVKLVSSPMRDWKIIAEVSYSERCPVGCEVGDRLVFSGPLLNVEESTCPLCVGAIAPMLERTHIMWDRIADGRDPGESWVRHSQCYDPGLEHGGFGRVVFNVYAEKAQ